MPPEPAMSPSPKSTPYTGLGIPAHGTRLGEWLESLGYKRPDPPAELAELIHAPGRLPPGSGSEMG